MAQLRKIGKGNNYFAYFHDVARTPKSKSVALGTKNINEAKKLLHKREREYRDGEFDPWAQRVEPVQADTLLEAADLFIERRSHLRPRTLDVYRSTLDQLAQQLPPRIPLRSITEDDIRTFVRDSSLAPATQKSRRGNIRVFFNWAVKQSLIEASPVEGVSLPKSPKPIPAYLSEADLKRLLSSIEAAYEEGRTRGTWRDGAGIWLARVVRFAVWTGLRRGEVCALRWDGVDLTPGRETITIRSRPGDFQTKTGHDIHLPVIGDAVAVLRELRAAPGGDGAYVFSGLNGGKLNGHFLSRSFKREIRRAGLDEGLHFHSLRHTTASWLAQKGIPAHTIAKILRHSDTSTTQIYTHHNVDSLRAAMQAGLPAVSKHR